MTIQEAIGMQESIKRFHRYDEEVESSCDMAILALEKRIPKKYEFKDRVPYCPCCGEIATTNTGDSFLDYWLSFCNKCGQKLGSDKY